jgi:spore coat polysaccharide biosynthesis predicted glycosyltransferase SpsG
MQVTVMLGAGSPHLEKLQAACKGAAFPCSLVVDCERPAELLLAQDLVVGAGGVSALERCCIGVPSVLIILAENQRRGAHVLYGLGAVTDVIDPSEIRLLPKLIQVDHARRTFVCERGRALVDGFGTRRAARAILDKLRE